MSYRFLRFPEGKPKAVTLSYDDGSVHDRRFIKTIDKYGIKCTFNLNSNRVLKESALTIKEINDLLETGHEVAVHGKNHYANGTVDPIDGIRDVLLCREELETVFDRIIRGMAYPNNGITRFDGTHGYETVRDYLKDLGVVYARTLGGDNDKFVLPTDWYAWMPSAHHDNPKIFEYIDKFNSLNPDEGYIASHYPRLFYMWGHSHEFNNKNNWERLDEICEKLSGKDDVWYATNIEIYEYVTAYHSLVRSADGKKYYNPTLVKIWFSLEGKNYVIDSGETLVITE